MADCVFCRIVSKQSAVELLYEDDQMAAWSDIRPQAPVHFLVVPKLHIPTLLDLEKTSDPLIGNMMRCAVQLAKSKGIAQDGFRAVFNCNPLGGQTVFHLHLHVLGGRAMGWPPG